MAVDFIRLPPEEPGPDHPPSRLIWTIVFFLIAIVGVFAALLLWPKGESTQTPWFWACVTVYPFGLAAFVVLRRYSVYEGRRLDAIAWNEARKDYVNGRAPGGQAGVQACVAYPGVEHEKAYQGRLQQLFALWAVTRIVANVKGTSLEYKQ
ncbi:hypothetical protein ACVCH0_01530 [Burkholderia glumae]